MTFDKKKIIIIISVLAFILVMAALGLLMLKSDSETLRDAQLEFWGTFDQRSFYETAIDAYTKLHPNISISYRELPPEDYESSLINAFAAGTGPDIWLMHNTWLAKHSPLIAPMPDNLKTAEGEPLFTLKDFHEKFVDVAAADLVRDDTVYGLPLYVDSLALYYNKDLLNSAGITEPPRTWEDFVRIVSSLTKIDDRGNIKQSAVALGTARNINRSTDILMLLMLQSGVRMTNVDNTSATFSQDVENLNVGELAMQFYTDFANQSKPDRYTWNDFQKYSIDAFADGNVAMMLNYSHQIKTLRAKAPRLNFGIASMPQPQGARITVNFGSYLVPTVAKQSPASDEAWKFLVYLAAGDGTASYLEASDRPAARRDLIERQRTQSELGVFAVQALSARSWYQADSAQIETIFADMIDDVNFGRFSIPDALQSAENKISVIMRKAQR